MQNFKKEELNTLLSDVDKELDEYRAQNLSLNMARGKPGKAQLELSNGILDPSLLGSFRSECGFDVRNYGVLDGIPEIKTIFSQMLGVPCENLIVFGNASLNIMYDYIAQCMLFGAGGEPWAKQGGIKFLCPVPGYDRHFAILQHFGIEMINIPMGEDGPDMALIEEYVRDEKVKGVICVPMYSNPGGVTFSDDVVRAFAALKPAAKDFRVIWDNAYCVHHLEENGDTLLNVFEVAKEYSSEDMFIEVTSTSKITFPGAGVSVMAASKANIASVKKRMTVQTIGHDKINMLRHAAFFKNYDGIKEHMKKHAAVIKPKFDLVLEILDRELTSLGIASWTKPKGGYFISLDVMPGTAKRTVELCSQAGVTLTGAGATYPYGKDPEDKNIRIAPTFPDLDELKTAAEILTLCVKKSAVEKTLEL
ncbi:MAG: aminotransferase [Clostridiales bacterium]|nr:aminotransferase [Clostridiales bacterium]